MTIPRPNRTSTHKYRRCRSFLIGDFNYPAQMITLTPEQKTVLKHYIRYQVDRLADPVNVSGHELFEKIRANFEPTFKPSFAELINECMKEHSADAARRIQLERATNPSRKMVTDEEYAKINDTLVEYIEAHPNENVLHTPEFMVNARAYIVSKTGLRPLTLVKPVADILHESTPEAVALQPKVNEAVKQYLTDHPTANRFYGNVDLRKHVSDVTGCTKPILLIKLIHNALTTIDKAQPVVTETVEDLVIQYAQHQSVCERGIVESEIPEWVAHRMNVTVNPDFIAKVNSTIENVLSVKRKFAKSVDLLLYRYRTNYPCNHCIAVVFLDVSSEHNIKCTTLFLWEAWKYCPRTHTFFPEPVTSGDETKYANVTISNETTWDMSQTADGYLNALVDHACGHTQHLYKPARYNPYNITDKGNEYPKTLHDGCIVNCSKPPTHIKLTDWKYYHIGHRPYHTPGYDKVLILSNEEYDLVFKPLWS